MIAFANAFVENGCCFCLNDFYDCVDFVSHCCYSNFFAAAAARNKVLACTPRLGPDTLHRKLQPEPSFVMEVDDADAYSVEACPHSTECHHAQRMAAVHSCSISYHRRLSRSAAGNSGHVADAD